MTKLRIVGIGSPAGDDQAGWLVVQALARGAWAQRCPPGTRLVALDRPGAQLIGHLEGADVAVLIDALRSGAAPGTIHRVRADWLTEPGPLVSSHGLGVASALALARALGALPATLLIYGIEIDPAATGGAPSEPVRAAVDALAQAIARELPRHLASARSATA
jgi:hydrogenase maturation protease